MDTSLAQSQLQTSSLASMSVEGERSSGVSSPSNSSANVDQVYLEHLLRERELLGVGAGMDLTRRLVNQGKKLLYYFFATYKKIKKCFKFKKKLKKNEKKKRVTK